MATIIIIAITALVSLLCFSNEKAFRTLMFNAYDTWNHRRYYQLFSYGLVHGSWGHLFFNMLTLFFFGSEVEIFFKAIFGDLTGTILYVVLYVTAIAISSVADLYKYRYTASYNAVGASGAVSAILFTAILLNPTMGIYIYFIPIPIPAFIFGPLYLIYCRWMAKRNADNIGHTAHFWGAIYGLVFPIIAKPALVIYFFNRLMESWS